MPKLNSTALYATQPCDWLASQDWSAAYLLRRKTVDGQVLAARYCVAQEADKIPFLVLHGGPGSGCQAGMLDWFEADSDTVFFPDQRGAGLSGKAGERILRRNTLTNLLHDIEAWRQALGIPCWHVVGGSWGATLAIGYAAKFPEQVASLILRGSFLARASDLRNFFAVRNRRRNAMLALRQAIGGLSSRSSTTALCHALDVLFQNGTSRLRQAVAIAWDDAERITIAGQANQSRRFARLRGRAQGRTVRLSEKKRLSQKFTVQAHYLARHCFLRAGGVVRGLSSLQRQNYPVTVLHGKFDQVCRPTSLQRMQQSMPRAQYRWVEAGHLASEPLMRAALQGAIRDMAARHKGAA